MSDHEIGHEEQVETAKPKFKKPRMYKVVLNNDDYTPMEFVVYILENFFTMDRAKATRVMMQVHNEGKGLCGVFSRDIAETKVNQVNEFARQNEHPLLCSLDVA
ncbi:MAG: ATP-dependent Clp protease adapter ClpS [Pseudomonadota bacterium]